MYGTQAGMEIAVDTAKFENDVKMYGTQAVRRQNDAESEFENDVKMYGTQAEDDVFRVPE